MESRYYCLFVTKAATSYDSFLANINLGDCNRERKKGGRKGVILIGEGVGEEEALEVKI